MQFPVFSASANPSIDKPLYHKQWAFLQNLLDTGAASYVNGPHKRAGVQLRVSKPSARLIADMGLAQAVTILSARGGLIPFVRVQNPLCDPPALHYAIPAVGARNRPMYASDVNGSERAF